MSPDGSGYDILEEAGRSAHDPTWSPDGEWIAYVRLRGRYTIRAIRSDGSEVRTLARMSGYWGGPEWSPRGDVLAFMRAGDGGSDIWTVDLDGTMHQLTDSVRRDSYPLWSPGGEQIAFTSARGEEGLQIYVMDADGSNERRLTDIESGAPDFYTLPRQTGLRTLLVSYSFIPTATSGRWTPTAPIRKESSRWMETRSIRSSPEMTRR